MKLFQNKKADAGIGTMIMFIAMIITASIAANMFIQSATSLQNQALKTGTAAREGVSTFMQVIDITASNGTDNTLEDFKVQLKLAPGSSDIKISDLLVSFNTNNDSVDLIYSANACEYNETTGYYTNSSEENGTFTLDYALLKDNHQHGYLQRGEIVDICFRSPSSVGEDKDVQIKIIPKVGFPTNIQFITPNVIFKTVERLYA